MEFERRILDHGYLRLVEHWGSDERIVEAARMSTGKGFLGWEAGPCPVCEGRADVPCIACEGKGTIPGDKKLLRRLHKKRHTTPFEMAGVVIEVAAPIMVFREYHRHRTWSYNEMSARYTPLPDTNYVPTAERLLITGWTGNKQAGTIKGADALTPEIAEEYQKRLREQYASQQEFYRWALERGVPKELARMHVGVGRYSRMRAQAVLLNVLKFLTLRMAPEAQFEIRVYANALGELVSILFPKTWELFWEGFQRQMKEDSES